jgi:hypothetical protein
VTNKTINKTSAAGSRFRLSVSRQKSNRERRGYPYQP